MQFTSPKLNYLLIFKVSLGAWHCIISHKHITKFTSGKICRHRKRLKRIEKQRKRYLGAIVGISDCLQQIEHPNYFVQPKAIFLSNLQVTSTSDFAFFYYTLSIIFLPQSNVNEKQIARIWFLIIC